MKSLGHISLAGMLALFLFFIATLVLQSCTGTKLLEEPIPVEESRPISQSADENIAASLVWVVVRDGPGTWAKNADWDEYWISVSNVSENDIELTGISILDSQGVQLKSSRKRSELVQSSAKNVERYTESGVDVTAGVGAFSLMAAGAATGAIGAGILTTVPVLGGAGAGAVVGIAAVISAPVLAVAGVYRGVHDRRVSKEIEALSTKLPLILVKGDTKLLKLFYPLALSPKQIEVTYKWTDGYQSLVIDTTEDLKGLHMLPPGSKKIDVRPEYEKDADLLRE